MFASYYWVVEITLNEIKIKISHQKSLYMHVNAPDKFNVY